MTAGPFSPADPAEMTSVPDMRLDSHAISCAEQGRRSEVSVPRFPREQVQSSLRTVVYQNYAGGRQVVKVLPSDGSHLHPPPAPLPSPALPLALSRQRPGSPPSRPTPARLSWSLRVLFPLLRFSVTVPDLPSLGISLLVTQPVLHAALTPQRWTLCVWADRVQASAGPPPEWYRRLPWTGPDVVRVILSRLAGPPTGPRPGSGLSLALHGPRLRNHWDLRNTVIFDWVSLRLGPVLGWGIPTRATGCSSEGPAVSHALGTHPGLASGASTVPARA